MVRMIQARWRLFLSGLVFLVLTIATLLLYGWHWTPGFLIAWDIGVVLYLNLVFWLAAQADTTFIRRRSELQDVGRFAVPGATVVGALASLIAVLYQLRTPAGLCAQPQSLVLAALTILLSWALIHTILALHYAHEFYAEHRNSGQGLEFPALLALSFNIVASALSQPCMQSSESSPVPTVRPPRTPPTFAGWS
jgi:uncharacterized membrane protein